MTEASVRNHLSYLLIVGHFGVLLLVVVLWSLHGFTFPEMTTSIALIAPMFATYTTAIIQYIVKNRNAPKPSSKPVSTGFVFISFLLPAVFLAVLLLMVTFKAFNIAFDGFDQFKIALAICESAFGVYIGKVVSALFKK